MNLQSFKDRVLAWAILLHMDGKPNALPDVIYIDPEWHSKWADALNGRFDA